MHIIDIHPFTDGHGPRGQIMQRTRHQARHVGRAAEAQTPAGPALPVGMHDAARFRALAAVEQDLAPAEFALDADVALAGRAEALRERVVRVRAGELEAREEGLAAGAHALDLGGVEGEVEVPLVGLGDAAEEEDVVVSRDDEDDFVVVGGVGGDGERALDLWEIRAVVDDADESASEWETGFVACQFLASKAGSVDDDVGPEALSKFVFLIVKVTVDSFGDELGAFALDQHHEPLHRTVGVDDRS